MPGTNTVCETHHEIPERGRLLIIDDEPAIVRALQRLFKDHEVVAHSQDEERMRIGYAVRFLAAV